MEILLLFIACLFFFLYGTYCGWIAREKHAINVIEQIAEKINVQEVLSNVIPVTIEKVDGMLYVYNGEDNTFMAQGKDRKSLEAALEERFPGKTFAANSSNIKEVGL